jgi:hypothetical protein
MTFQATGEHLNVEYLCRSSKPLPGTQIGSFNAVVTGGKADQPQNIPQPVRCTQFGLSYIQKSSQTELIFGAIPQRVFQRGWMWGSGPTGTIFCGLI